MFSILIPYFLTTQLTVDDGLWQHGPQYKFNANVHISAVITDNVTTEYIGNITNQLICRPKESDTLSCHLNVFKYDIIEDNLTTNESTVNHIDSSKMHEMDGMPFEIKFDQKGVHSIIVPENWTDADTKKVSIIKSVAELLSVGTDLRDRDDGDFKEMETFILGECMSDFSISHEPNINEENREESDNFGLNLVAPLTKKPGESVLLTRKRDYNNCKLRHMYTFITPFILRDPSSVLTNATSSTRWMHITDNTFSSTIRTFVHGLQIKNLTITELTENYKLSLEGIEPAEGDLPKVDSPVSIPIFDPATVDAEKTKNYR